jgi:hypothetical protein
VPDGFQIDGAPDIRELLADQATWHEVQS